MQVTQSPWGEAGSPWWRYARRARAEELTAQRVLLPGYLLDRYYLGERVLDFSKAPAARRVPSPPPRHVLSTWTMTPGERDSAIAGATAEGLVNAAVGGYPEYILERLTPWTPFSDPPVRPARLAAVPPAQPQPAPAGPEVCTTVNPLFLYSLP